MRVAIATAILLVVGMVPLASVPLVSATHFSVGNQDSVGLQPTEAEGSPSICNDASLPGCEEVSDLWLSGTSTTNADGDCEYEPSGDLADAQAEATAATSADAFCGELVYNTAPGQGDYTQVSPPDQDYPGGNAYELTFDAVWSGYVGNYGLSTCLPVFCPGITGSQLLWETVHNTGAQAGISDNAEEANEKEDPDHFQQFAANLQFPQASLVASQASGLYSDSNGWLAQTGDQSIVAFLQTPREDIDLDGDGNVDDDELKALVDGKDLDGDGTEDGLDLKSQGVISASANSLVCAFTPEADVAITATQGNFCEVIFNWFEEEKNPDTDFDGYKDPCGSATYVCGANQPAWYAQLVCKVAPVTGSGWGCAASGGSLGPDSTFATRDTPSRSTTDYDIWHFTVAPAPIECDAEPGFQFATKQDATIPYLAHDLDIFEPATGAVGVDQTDPVREWGHAFGENAGGSTIGTVTGLDVGELLPAERYAVDKDYQVEPNNPGDTSQSLAGVQAETDDPELVRTTGDDCAAFRTGQETHFDPWVDLIDSQVSWSIPAVLTDEPIHADLAAHQHQDAGNAGTTMTGVTTSGQVGMFTDIDDDGEYDQAASSEKSKEAIATGAYELIYDIRVDETTGQLDTDGGCTGGFGQTTITEQASQAGYGAYTGLLQVVYSDAISAPYHDGLGFLGNVSTGDTAYVLLSQSLQAHVERDDPVVQTVIDNALAKVPGFSQSTDVRYVSQEANTTSDFLDQCRQGTGGFSSLWDIVRLCAPGCQGDTVVTSYVMQLPDGTIGGGEIKAFDPDADGTPYDFNANPAGFYDSTNNVHQWFDVDPIDGDETRNTEGSSAPPAEEEDPLPAP